MSEAFLRRERRSTGLSARQQRGRQKAARRGAVKPPKEPAVELPHPEHPLRNQSKRECERRMRQLARLEAK